MHPSIHGHPFLTYVFFQQHLIVYYTVWGTVVVYGPTWALGVCWATLTSWLPCLALTRSITN